jgi:CubicO group peptidase (beta-lactamase class C family)
MLRPTSPANVRSVSNRYSLLATIVLATLTLTACGGGGGGDSSPPPASPANPPPPPPPPANNAPVAEAGAAQTITLPTNAVDLAGSATDADNNPITYAWTSDPATGVTFADAAAAATRVTFTDAGTYTLTLTANDGTGTATATGTDTVVITVNAAPPVALVWPGASSATDPNRGWVTATAAEVGMDSARLIEAEVYSKKGGGAGMITRHGKLVHKWSDDRGDADPVNDIHIGTRADLKSTTKSMGGIALALALDAGLVKLDDLAKTHLPSFGNPPANDPAALDAITVRHLATHTAGFAKPGSPRPAIEHGPPGTKWFYSDGGLNWLADLLTTKYNRDLHAVLTEEVWGPLEITNADLLWSNNVVDANNLHFRNLASDIVANPNAMARVGLLYLRKGMWKETRIISEASVALASKPVPEIASATVVNPTDYPQGNLNYGLLWWTNATKQLADVPADAYWAWGLGDSLIVVIPSLDIVVARIGSGAGNTAGPHWRPALTTYPTLPKFNGDYEILRPFLTPIVQSVTTP